MKNNNFADYITDILLKYFVPMDKWERHGWEVYLIRRKWFPFRELIYKCWHDRIKLTHPNIGIWAVGCCPFEENIVHNGLGLCDVASKIYRTT